MKRIFTLLALVVGFSGTTLAQGTLEPKSSPLDISTTTVGETYIKVVYSRPHKKGRNIFGGLVPFNKVWRTGANAATEITFTGDVEINGEEIEAGTYSLYTIPSEDSWTVILNSDLGQWGAYRYNEDNDVLRFEVETQETEVTWEPFTIVLETEGRKSNLKMMWDTTMVSFKITPTND
ncbi:MAG: DUF2911 domain-containing protein [Bacteroidetes bacterium]|nr:MAG: DUF2911 domain-containing protein [Bacteroidota bacterium]